MKSLYLIVFVIFFVFANVLNVKAICTQDSLKTNVVKISAYQGIEEDEGGGIVLGSKDKYLFILTAWHIIDGKKNIEVSFYGEPNNKYKARRVNHNDILDIAIISVEITGKNFMKLPICNNIKKGQNVSVVGHPYDNVWRVNLPDNIVTDHIYDDDIRMLSINNEGIRPGSSGGILFSKNNELVGIMTGVTSLDAVAIKFNGIIPVLEEKWGIPLDYFNFISNSNSENEKLPEECEQRNTGAIKVINHTGSKKYIYISGSYSPLWPKESKVFYDISASNAYFLLYNSKSNGEYENKYYDNPEVMVHKCKVTTYNITH